ncbi:hypothetical protein [Microbacterium faecale]|nr:hypothetical protein [Microbacterium faecale]
MTSPATPAPYGYASPTPRGSGRSGLAITALVIAIVAVAISTSMSVVQFTMYDASFETIRLWAFIASATNVVSAIVSLVALILGILALRGSRPAVSGVAVGISAAHIFGTVTTTLFSLVVI